MTTDTKSFTNVERAFYYAVRLMTRMDECAGYGNATDVPEVIVWAIQQLKPELLAPLRDNGGHEQLLELLRHFRPLRAAAEKSRSRYIDKIFAGVPGDDEGHLTLGFLVDELNGKRWRRNNAPVKAKIDRVVRAVGGRYADQAYRAWPYRDLENSENLVGPPLEPPTIEALSLVRLDSLDAKLPMSADAAFQYAKAQLLACDDGHIREFWPTAYTSVIGDWLTYDMPDTAEAIFSNGLAPSLSSAVSDYVGQMVAVEEYWRLLSHPIRALLLRLNDDALAVKVISDLIADKKNESADSVDAWAHRVWEMTKRRAIPPSRPLAEPLFTSDTNTLIEAIRDDGAADAAGYVVDASALPEAFSSVVKERFALVVRLHEDWVDAKEKLKSDWLLQSEFHEAARREDCRLMLCVSNALYIHQSSLWPHLFRFRRVIPVMYVFRERVALMGYDFHQFSNLETVRNMPRGWIQSTRLEVVLEKEPRPALALTVRDLTSSPVLTPLGQAMEEDRWPCRRPV